MEMSRKPRPPTHSELSLCSGDYALSFLPDLGGSLSRLTWRGRDMLRPARAEIVDPFDAASFPLVPYANRIANGVFRFEGQEIRLTPNLESHPHPLHGQAWLAPWRVVEQDEDRARLLFLHDIPDEWPWAYSVEQIIALSADGVRIDLRIANLSQEAMPVSYGFHPYFPKLPGARFITAARGVWLADEDLVPTVPADGSHFLSLEKGVDLATAPFVDHCHTGWRGAATIIQPSQGMSLEMEASPDLGFLHIFTPKAAAFFCLEPVSAMPDAMNRSEPDAVTGLKKIAPGETASAYITLSARTFDASKQSKDRSAT